MILRRLQLNFPTKNGTFYTTNFDLSNRYQEDILRIEKLYTEKTWSAIYFDNESKCFYLKRFSFEPNDNVPVPFISDAEGSYLVEISDNKYPSVVIKFGGKNAKREDEVVDGEEFIGKKSYKAKGKRLTTYDVAEVRFGEPLVKESEEVSPTVEKEAVDEGSKGFEPGSVVEFGGDSDDDNPTLF